MGDLLTLGPNVIGATGGSGTRAFARIVRRGGMYIGNRLNLAEDALDFGDYSDRWINPFLESGGSASPEMLQDLEATLTRHLQGMGAAQRPWGWKEPRSIYLLTFFHRRFPALRFLHVVRDGRDMAYSSNQNQLRKHGDRMLGAAAASAASPALRSLALWRRVNLKAAEYGENVLRDRYWRVRFEDLCADPIPVIRHIFEFFGLTGDAAETARQEVAPPESLGRWKRLCPDEETRAALHHVAGDALRKFGYEETHVSSDEKA